MSGHIQFIGACMVITTANLIDFEIITEKRFTMKNIITISETQTHVILGDLSSQRSDMSNLRGWLNLNNCTHYEKKYQHTVQVKRGHKKLGFQVRTWGISDKGNRQGLPLFKGPYFGWINPLYQPTFRPKPSDMTG